MKRQPSGLHAIALAVGIVVLIVAGVPVSTLMFAALALTCPLMMLLMHGGHVRPGIDNSSEVSAQEPSDEHLATVGSSTGVKGERR